MEKIKRVAKQEIFKKHSSTKILPVEAFLK